MPTPSPPTILPSETLPHRSLATPPSPPYHATESPNLPPPPPLHCPHHDLAAHSPTFSPSPTSTTDRSASATLHPPLRRCLDSQSAAPPIVAIAMRTDLLELLSSPPPWFATIGIIATILGALAAIASAVHAYYPTFAANRRPSDRLLPAATPPPKTPRVTAFWRLTRIPFSLLRTLHLATDTPDREELVRYLDDFAQSMKDRNPGEPIAPPLTVLPQPSVLAYSLTKTRVSLLRRIRSVLRRAPQSRHRLPRLSAPLALLHRHHPGILNPVRMLRRTRRPLVLLGDPGSGKSYTLRQVAAELARYEIQRPDPKLIVFVSLSQYSTELCGAPGSVRELIANSLPTSCENLRQQLQVLTDAGRLVVFFDGIDEMPRSLYRARVSRLSGYARHNRKRVKTIFSCRTNDFPQELQHIPLGLHPFTRRQVIHYLRRNLHLPITISGTRYTQASAVATTLLNRPELSDLATNPLLLSLIVGHISHEEKWPTTRHQIFDAYLGRIYETRLANSSLSFSRLCEDWATLAYEMADRRTKAAAKGASVMGHSNLLPSTPEIVAAAEKCGLILRDLDDSQRIDFVHHQFQEYLAAEYLAKAGEKGVRWEDLVWRPRKSIA